MKLNEEKKNRDTLEKALKRKEKYLSENRKYRLAEALMHRHTAGKFIGDFIYGANDGTITTFAVVAGAVGASLSPNIIIILGFANLLADGISMGASNYLGGKSERDYAKFQREKEGWEVDHLRELEVEEIREIFAKKGFTGRDLDRAVSIIISDREVWLDTMMRDELNILEDEKDDPKLHGVATFGAFVIAGLFPLLPYVLPLGENAFLISVIFGAGTLFVVGALRSIVTAVSWFRGGVEMFLIGSSAATVAYFVGAFIETLVG
ncbi:MAG: VIT1/CCC1 transporter family protein [Candidatus Curtissbacteria bacterium]